MNIYSFYFISILHSTFEETPETPAILPPMAQASSHTNAPHFKSLFTLMPDASLSVAQQDEDFQFAVIIVIRDPKSRISSTRKKDHLPFEPIVNIARCFRTEDEALEYTEQESLFRHLSTGGNMGNGKYPATGKVGGSWFYI